MNATATANTLKNLLTAMVEDLRRRRLLPVAALLLALLVAVPIVLAHSSSPSPASDRPATAGSPPQAATPVGVAKPRTGHAPRLLAHGRDPFPQGRAGATSTGLTGSGGTAAQPASHPAAAGVSPAAAPSTTHPATTTTPVPTVTRTVTVTTPAPAPKLVYASYLPALSFGQSGQSAQSLSDAPRFTVLPSLNRVAALFLGIRGDGRTAEFLVSNRATVTGDGSCHPSRSSCLYLTLRPGQEELFLLRTAAGQTFEYALHYGGTRVHHSATVPTARVSKAGRHLVAEVAKLVPSLRTLRYSAHGGLLTLSEKLK